MSTASADVSVSPYLYIALALFWIAIILLPFAKLLKRTGHKPAWSVFFVIPLVNVVALWIFAFRSWPIDKQPHP